MDPKADLLQVALSWLGSRGLLGLFLAAVSTVLRWLLGFCVRCENSTTPERDVIPSAPAALQCSLSPMND